MEQARPMEILVSMIINFSFRNDCIIAPLSVANELNKNTFQNCKMADLRGPAPSKASYLIKKN